MMRRECYHSRSSLGKRALMLLLGTAMVLTMMPMLPGYVGEASGAASYPAIKGIDIYQGGTSATGTKVYSFNPVTKGWTNGAGESVAKPELTATEEYYVKLTIEKVNATDDAWVSVSVPSGIVFKNVPGGTTVGGIDTTYLDQLLVWNDLPAFASNYNPTDGMLKWHIKAGMKTVTLEFSIRADVNNFDFNPGGMTIKKALKVEAGLASGSTANVVTMDALETMPPGGASELLLAKTGTDFTATPEQEEAFLLGRIIITGMSISTMTDALSDIPFASSVEGDITYPTGAQLTKVEYNQNHPTLATLGNPMDNGDGTTTVHATMNFDGSNHWLYAQSWYTYFVWPDSMTGTTQTVRFSNVKWVSRQTGREITIPAANAREVKVAIGSATTEVLTTVPMDIKQYNYTMDGKTDMNYPVTQFLFGNTGADSDAKEVTIEYDANNQATIRMITLPISLAAGTVLNFTMSDGERGTYTIPASQANSSSSLNKSWVIKNTDLSPGTVAGISKISFSGWVIPQGFKSNVAINSSTNTQCYTYHPFQAYGTFNGAGATAVESNMTITSEGIPVTTCTSTCTPVSKATYYGYDFYPTAINGGQPLNITAGYGGTINGSIALNVAIIRSTGGASAATNILADPVLYAFMPAGFSYSELRIIQNGADLPYEITTVVSPAAEAVGITVTRITFTQDVRTGCYRLDDTYAPISVSTKINVDNSVQIGSYDIGQFFGVAAGDGHDIQVTGYSTNTAKVKDDYNVNGGRSMMGVFKGTISVNENKIVQITNSMADSGGNWITYNGTDATTGFIKAGTTTRHKVNVKNITGNNLSAGQCKIYIPIPKEGQDLGEAFNPEGAFEFDLSKAALVGSVPTGWQIKYYNVTGQVGSTGTDPGAHFTTMTEITGNNPANNPSANMMVISNNIPIPDAQAVGGQADGQDFIFDLTAAGGVESGKKNVMNCTPVYTIDGNLIASAGSPIAMEVANGIVTGYVYNDVNRNGKRDSGETGIANVTVTVRDSFNHVSQATTDSDGKYELTGLRDGSGVKTSVQIENNNVSALTFHGDPVTDVTFDENYPTNVTADATQAYASKTDIALSGLTNHTAYVNAAICTPVTLMFNANGGALNNVTQTVINGPPGGTVKLPTLKTRNGYTCQGWYTDQTGGAKIGDQGANFKVPEEPDTYFAQWQPITYNIEYTLDGGTAASDAPITYTAEAAVLLKNPTKKGYTFTGWSGSNGTTPQIIVIIPKDSTGNKSYTANWTANSYTIKFDSKGGSGTMSDLAMTYDVAKPLTANSFTKEGYTFEGWNTEADGSGTAYADKASVKNLTETAGGTVTLYAQWKPHTYTVTFDSNTGTGEPMADLAMTYDVAKPLTANSYTKEGYTFDGWTTEADGSGTAYTDKQSVKNLTAANDGTVTLYAQWKANTYTVKFDSNNGAGAPMVDLAMTYDEAKSLTANSYTKEGYTFTGWNTKANGSGNAYTDEQSVNNLTATNNSTVTLYAQWTPSNYTITFDANEGTGAMADLAMTYDTAKELTANAFIRTGYTFVGWNTKANNGGTAYMDRQFVSNLTATNNGTVTLYAQWNPNSYTILFDSNTGAGTMTELDMDYDAEKALPANAFTKDGYTFKEWNREADGSGTAYADEKVVKNLATSSTVTLYTQWTPNTYTVTFDSNTGTGSPMADLAMTYDVAKPLTANTYTKEGYTFVGWSTEAGGSGTAYTDEESVNNLTKTKEGTVTLYAQWKPNTYIVKFDGNTGDGTMDDLDMDYDAEKALTANAFTKDGYTFKEWNTEADGSGTTYTDEEPVNNLTDINNGTVTLYAQWMPNTYTVTFDGNTGTGTPMDELTMTYDMEKVLTTNTYTKQCFTFTGWNTESDGSGTAYTDEQSVSNLTTTNNGTVTLYAQWKQNDITIDDIPIQTYTTKAIEPPVVVKIDGIKLTPGTDYSVAYSNNTKPGAATVTVTCKGEYTGTKTAQFTIKNYYKAKGQWVSSHENTYVTFNWTGTPDNKLATGWDIMYRTKLIGTQYPWTAWTEISASGKTLSKRLYLKPNHTIEFKVKHETDNTYLRSVFTTPAGGIYQSVTQCRVKVVAGGTATNIKAGTNYSGDSGNVITIKKGQTVKITPNHVYPRSNYSKYPRLYPNHAWYDVADKSVVSLIGMSSTAGMMDSAITIKGLKAGTTTVKITSCNGRGATLTIVVK